MKHMAITQERGGMGEDAAARHLLDKGYKILERNHRKPWGELDIIATAGDGILVFVEVKAMTMGSLAPEHHMTASKIMKTKRAALAYANANPHLTGRGWRIDVIAVDLNGDAAGDIRHYENI